MSTERQIESELIDKLSCHILKQVYIKNKEKSMTKERKVTVRYNDCFKRSIIEEIEKMD